MRFTRLDFLQTMILKKIYIEPEGPVLSGTESDGEGSLEKTNHQPSKADVENYLRTLNLFLQSKDRITKEHYKTLKKLDIFLLKIPKKKVNFRLPISEYFNSF